MAHRKKNPLPALAALARAHGFALVPRTSNPAPRRGAAKPKRASQRLHRNKNGTFTKAPTKRLVTRRKKNVRKGYFPNPAAIARAHRSRAKPIKLLQVETQQRPGALWMGHRLDVFRDTKEGLAKATARARYWAARGYKARIV